MELRFAALGVLVLFSAGVVLADKPAATVRGSVSLSAPKFESDEIDGTKLLAYVRSRKGALQQCFEKELRKSPTLAGKVSMRFSITPTGRSADVSVEENTAASEPLGQCLQTTVRGWVFPFKPQKDVSVLFPFQFQPAT